MDHRDSDDFGTHSSYLVKVLSLYRERGIHFYGLSLQNEPLFDRAVYPCMYLSATDAIRLTKLTGPKLRVSFPPIPNLITREYLLLYTCRLQALEV